MKYSAIATVSIFFISAFLFTCCDSDKYLGYNYSAEKLDNRVIVAGQVRDFFTGQPVANTTVNFGGVITSTLADGSYQLVYLLQADEGFGRAVPVIFSRDKYFPLQSSLVIYPQDNSLDARLVYAAPIIRSSTFQDSVCTATVFDYQGVTDIDSVFAMVTYVDVDSGYTVPRTFPMPLQSQLDDNTGVFQTVVKDSLDAGRLDRHRYRIFAIDKSNFTDARFFFF